MKKSLLFIANCDIFSDNFGGSKVSYRNYILLKNFFNVDLVNFSYYENEGEKLGNVYTLKIRNKFYNIMNYFIGYSGYLNFYSEKEIIKILKKNNYDFIFIDSSNYGKLLKKIKKLSYEIKVIVFFHNLEFDFIKDYIKSDKSKLKYIKVIKLLSTYYNEYLAVKYSNYIISLNLRDTKKLCEVYGGKSNLELPVTFEDKYYENINNFFKEKDYILFIGALFFANYNGIKWFIENVMPYVNKKLLIVGKDFETKKSELERENVIVIGRVDDVSIYYLNASCMVMPIFDGAGMKVKTAEALMYGKTIYGTTEAFEGYEVEYNKIGGLCNTKEEFIEKINNDKNLKFNEYSRKIFLEKYSFESSVNRMKEFLEKENLI